MTLDININELLCIDNYLKPHENILTMSIQVVYDLNFAKCYPSPSRNWIDTKISIISIQFPEGEG